MINQSDVSSLIDDKIDILVLVLLCLHKLASLQFQILGKHVGERATVVTPENICSFFFASDIKCSIHDLSFDVLQCVG